MMSDQEESKQKVNELDPFSSTFLLLKDSPRELFVIFLLKYLESYAYFVLSYTMILFLSDEFGFTDEEAGWAYGIYNMLCSVYGFAIGALIDRMGVKWSLVCGTFCLMGSRLVLTFANSVHVLLFILFGTLPLGGSLGIPVMQIGIKRFTNESNRKIAFNLFYMMMNLAAITAAPAIDAFHQMYPHGINVFFYGATHHISSFRMLFFSGACMTFMSMMLSLFCIRGALTTPTKKSSSFLDSYKTVLGSRRFWKFFSFIVILIGVRVIFRHLDATFPKYMVREFGSNVMYGSIIAINPLCVVCFLPLLSTFSHVNSMTMICIGATVSSLAPFMLAMGHSYFTAVGFVVILSIGEAIWSPRLYEYTVQVAEQGSEGIYMALASTPMFVATLLTGAMSGHLLDYFCPVLGVRHTEVMWFIIALMALPSPLLLMCLRKHIEDETTIQEREPPRDLHLQ